MIDNRLAPYAFLLLRLSLGILFFIHAGIKIFIFTLAGTAGFSNSLGVPDWMAYVTMSWEVLGATALVLGIWPRFAALAVIPVLLGVIASVLLPAGFFFSNLSGGWEFPALWIVGLLTVALAGDGPLAVEPTHHRSVVNRTGN